MKRTGSEKVVFSSSPLRAKLALALMCLGIGGGAGYELATQPRDEQIEKLNEQLSDKTKDLLKCSRDNRRKAKVLMQATRRLGELQASKDRLNDWRNFLRGPGSGAEEGVVTEDDKFVECRDLEGMKREDEALKFLDYMGITNENDRQAIIDSYKQGCYVNDIQDDGKLNMQQKVSPWCQVELEEPLEKNNVDMDAYAEGSDAERAALDQYREKNYEEALVAYEPVLNEAYLVAEANPEIKGLPFYENFTKALRGVYGDFKAGNSLDGMCRIGYYLEILGDLEENEDLAAAIMGDAEEDLMVIFRKLVIFGDIALNMANRDHPEFRDKGFDSPEVMEACAQRGISYNLSKH